MTHKGIEFRIELDGKPIVITDSQMMHNLLKIGGGKSRDLLDAVNLGDVERVAVIVRAVEVSDDDDADQAHAQDCEADEAPPAAVPETYLRDEELAVLRAEIRGVFMDLATGDDEAPRTERVHHWWDRPELVNWAYRASGSSVYGLMIVHLPCGHCEYRIESLTESIARAAKHVCERDQPPADADPIEIRNFIADRSPIVNRGRRA